MQALDKNIWTGVEIKSANGRGLITLEIASGDTVTIYGNLEAGDTTDYVIGSYAEATDGGFLMKEIILPPFIRWNSAGATASDDVKIGEVRISRKG